MDRDIDALVAEKLFGERILRHPAFVDGPQIAPVGEQRRHLPEYSTNIVDAWLVVEKMRADGWRFIIAGVDEGIAASFRKGDSFEGNEPYQVSGPMAIVKAALKALGVENEAH